MTYSFTEGIFLTSSSCRAELQNRGSSREKKNSVENINDPVYPSEGRGKFMGFFKKGGDFCFDRDVRISLGYSDISEIFN